MKQFRRRVFYVSGYDPRGVRYYYHLLHDQLKRFSVLTGKSVKLSKRRFHSKTRSDWTVENQSNNVLTEYSFLRWEDIVQQSWIRSPLQLGLRAIKAYWNYILHFEFVAARRLARGPLVTLFYPPALSILLPLIAASVIFLITSTFLPPIVAILAAVIAGVALARPVLMKIRAPWLLRFFIFNSELGKGEDNANLSLRLDDFAEQIEAALSDEFDEILLIAHSNGSILSMQIMARILARQPAHKLENFTLVTLGHCIPLIACRRDATGFHEQLRFLATKTFRWVDIGSPPDGAAYFGVNPLLIKTQESRPTVELLSPRFHKFHNMTKQRRGLGSKYDIHFDYLRIGDRPSPIDFPHLVAGNLPIAQSVAIFRTLD